MENTQRIPSISPAVATGNVKEMLGAVKEKLGMVPNTFQVMANSEVVLEGYLGLMGTLDKGSLPFETRNQISIAVSEINKCAYCLSAFTAIGKGAGVSDQALDMCRVAGSEDPKVDAALKFTRAVMQARGAVTDEDVEKVRSAGYTNAEIQEIVANVALYSFINYINLVAHTEIDFPLVTPH